MWGDRVGEKARGGCTPSHEASLLTSCFPQVQVGKSCAGSEGACPRPTRQPKADPSELELEQPGNSCVHHDL